MDGGLGGQATRLAAAADALRVILPDMGAVLKDASAKTSSAVYTVALGSTAAGR